MKKAVILCCLFFLVLLLVYMKEVVLFFDKTFSKSMSLNYPTDIQEISVMDKNTSTMTIISNKKDINVIIDMLNSLELVELKNKRMDYSKPYIQMDIYIKGSETKTHYGHSVGSAGICDTVLLSEQYIVVFPEQYEYIYYIYYIRNSKSSFQDEILQHINSLL